ncbi:hypothetical protein [Erwinia sp. V71]|uniref:hypothetical protein n=1 Tax=Erwinia sp. V71 TaxID=3369424 RepID=UPI003F61B9B7
MVDIWQKKEEMFKTVSITMKRVELTLDMRSNFRSMSVSSRNAVLFLNKKNTLQEWRNLLEQKTYYIRNRKLLVDGIKNDDYPETIIFNINEIINHEDEAFYSLFTPAGLALENNHKEAIEYLAGPGRQNQRMMFDLLTKLLDRERDFGKKTIKEYREELSSAIINASVLVFIGFVLIVIVSLLSIYVNKDVKYLNRNLDDSDNKWIY